MTAWICGILGALFLLVLLVLLSPIGYQVDASRTGGECSIRFFGGLYRKRKRWPEKKPTPGTEEKEADAAQEEKSAPAKIEKETPISLTPDGQLKEETEKAAHEETEPADEEADEEGVSTGALLCRAAENGAARIVLSGLWKILCHSSPGEISFTGRMGTGDPMKTGLLAGAMYAVFPRAARIEWDYTQKVTDAAFHMKGRIIPIYIIYIAGTTLLARPVRSILAMKRRNHHGRRSKKEAV